MKRPYLKLDICDNTPGCPVIEACPKNIFNYNYNLKKLLINENNCHECENCVPVCDYGAVIMVDKEEIANMHQAEEDFGMSKASNIAGSYGIEPLPILEDHDIEQLSNLKDIAAEETALVYVYGIWHGESYLGYAFFKEMVAEIKPALPETKFYKIDVENYHGELRGLPAYLIIKNGEEINSYQGIKNPLYFASTLITDLSI